MMIEGVVINASPLITLFRSGQAELLPLLFARIVVPEAVWQEVVQDKWEDQAARQLGNQPWALRMSVTDSPRVAAWVLGAGETAVLSHALANPPLRAVIDDMDARRCARTLGIPILGTGGLLILAKRRGLIASVGEAIEKLRHSGLWMSEDIIRILKTQAGE
ncbi:MAG: twitching motility protein PilT [Deltaproteobacteria bacterium RIFOXYD12_FULL_56_24]|nr:MAG: twitching motility protein PilT [Deltaproteobacteria bacterium RIFOXYD12_FULL_56_24]